MLSYFKKVSCFSCKPSINFYVLFPLIFGLSSLISTTSVKFHVRYFRSFLYFQIFNVVLGLLTHFGTSLLIQVLRDLGFVGTNLNDLESSEKVPEPGSLLGCVLYIIFVILLQFIQRNKYRKFPELNSGLTSIVLMTLLGIIDDIFSLNWSSKIVGPVLASFPLCFYYSGNKTSLIKYLPSSINKEPYYPYLNCLYIILLTVFCSNSINIYSGINGLEVGQSLVISFFIIIYSSLEIFQNRGKKYGELDIILEKQICSLYLSLPFIAISIPILCFNWYPAKLFVGNVYTLFAGALFSVVLIIGNMGEIMPLIFLPQLINFFLSIPQLLGIIECPRHRIPRFGIINPISEIRFNHKTKKLENSGNLTLLNMVLKVIHPMEEHKLSLYMIIFQIFCGFLALMVKYCVI